MNDDTLILGIETSCDETAASVVRRGVEVLSDVVASQVNLHAEFGGVVPELACRAHAEAIVPTVKKALSDAGVEAEELDAVAVTRGPGLVGALLVGLSFAKAYCWAKGLALVPVNHLEAHLAAAFVENDGLEAPFVGLVVSGGHTALYHCGERGSYKLLGQTLDDAAGEAFDKVAKLMGLGYPGGVVIDKLAVEGDPERYKFPRPMLNSGDLDFSFSGLKTSVRTHCEKLGGKVEGRELEDTCASFQEAAVDTLLKKTFKAVNSVGADRVVVCGGVACNSRLRARFGEFCEKRGIALHIPRPRFCTDNGVMVAGAGYHLYHRGVRADDSLTALPTWPLEEG